MSPNIPRKFVEVEWTKLFTFIVITGIWASGLGRLGKHYEERFRNIHGKTISLKPLDNFM